MAYDGSLTFDTSIDTKGFDTGVTKIKGLATKNLETVKNTVKSSSEIAADSMKTNVTGIEAAAKKIKAIVSGGLSAAKTALKTSATIAAAEIAGIGVGTAKVAKESVKAYADYEQFVGGIDTLFKQSSKKVQQYAANAYKTAGLSANEYMDTVTSFSASLISSLGGDTEAAVKYADMAITDMSDNANKMGTDMQSIQYAYQGFAKQNYTMLDNLKLGYGGTTTEMERLLKDAEKLSGQKFDIASYADVVEAVHVIQQSMGITGTTAKEAEHTISGSIGSLKSAAKNLLVGFGNTKSNIQQLCTDMVDSFKNVATNVSPIVSNVAKSLPTVTKTLLENLRTITPSILDDVTNLFSQITAKVGNLLGNSVKKVAEYIPEIIKTVGEILGTIKNTLLELLPLTIRKPVEATISALGTTISKVAGVFESVFEGDTIKEAIKFAADLISSLTSVLTDMINNVMPSVEQAFEDLKTTFKSDGFRKGVQAAKDIFKIFGETMTNIAKVVIPIVTGAFQLIAEHLNIIIPLLSTAVIIWGEWKVISTVSDLCKKFVGTMTDVIGKIQGYITETETAMATTSGLSAVIAGAGVGAAAGTFLAALVILCTWLATTTGETADYNDAAMKLSEQQEKTAESAETLGEKLNSIGEYAKEFRDGIDKAKSSLDGIDDSIIIDTQKCETLKTNMDTTQKSFNDIASKYSNGRKQMTNKELESLTDLFKEMRNIAKEQLELLENYQDASKSQVEGFVTGFSGSAEEYAEASKSYIKGAEESRDKVIAAADEQFRAQTLNINKIKGLTDSERKKKLQNAYEDYNTAVKQAKNECAATMQIIVKGYTDKNNANEEFLDDVSTYYQQYENAVSTHTKNVESLRVNAGNNETAYKKQYLEEGERFEKRNQEIYDNFAKNFDEAKQKQVGTWLEMVKATTNGGQNIDEQTAATCQFMLQALNNLSPEAKAKMKTTIDGLQGVVDNLPQNLKTTSENAADEFAKGLANTPSYVETKNNATKLRNTVENEIEKLPNILKKETEKAIEAVTDGMKTVGNIGASLGKDFVAGYTNAIDNESATAVLSGMNLALNAAIGIKKGQNSNSPSKVTRKLGNYFTQGYILGIEENESDVKKSAVSLANNAISGIGKKMSNSIMTARVALETDTVGFISAVKDKIKNAQFAAQLKAAAVAQSASITNTLVGKTYSSNNIAANGNGTIKASGNIETHININGREFALATVPYFDEELAFMKG